MPAEVTIEGHKLTVGKRLGRGALGVAYLINWPGTPAGPAVLKKFHRNTGSAAKEVKGEIKRAKAVGALYATADVEGVTYAVLQLAPGVTLKRTSLYKAARAESVEACKAFMKKARNVMAKEEIRIRDATKYLQR